MSATWEHPELGAFEYGGAAWTKRVNVPAFDVFTYEARYGDTRQSAPRYSLEFEADDETDRPSADAITLASQVLANQTELVSAVTTTLWEDFNGRGPKSGIWWHGGINEVADDEDDVDMPPLTGPDALLAWMRFSGVTVRKSGSRNEGLVAELGFGARFEEEHGVGVLTDGRTILGTGYRYSVEPFKST